MKIKHNLWLLSMIPMLIGINTYAQDWPQWRGLERNGLSKESGLNLEWSAKKPSLLWTFRDAGSGYASPAVAGTTLYCQGSAENQDFVFALDTQTGALKWKQNLGDEHVSYQNRGHGPRGSVTMDGDKLYLIRGGGQIHCLLASDGKLLWQKDLVQDFGGKMMSDWGYSESPLIDGNLVICSPGGDEGTLVAFDKNNGYVVWRTWELLDKSAYSSPIVAQIEGVRQYIQLTEKRVAGIAAKDGKLLWSVEVPGFRTAVIPTPICVNNTVYVTTGYNVGCLLITLSKEDDVWRAEEVYANKNMGNQHGGVVLINGHIYGYSDFSGWVCQNFETGEAIWSTGRSGEIGIGKGAVLGVGDRLICQEERSGLLAVAEASPDGWKELGRMPFPERTQIVTTDNMVWTHPVVSHGKLYLRDHDLLFCYDLR
ncbi:MAG: PQQ-binding-like beta-propeller repeat protein [Prevotellaceae bacterium]|jgi:outer membrane protein assembly factor BamB|nr:PQQ-binding-like beta-propeller repeat protein [Prevotellaceae bacterium]